MSSSSNQFGVIQIQGSKGKFIEGNILAELPKEIIKAIDASVAKSRLK